MSNLLFVTVGQSFLELPTCVKEAAHDGSLRYSQRFGDFLVAQPFELAQDDDGLVVARQDIESGLEPGRDFTPPQSIERIRSLDTSEKWSFELVGFRTPIPFFLEGVAVSARPASVIDAEVGDDAIEPSEKGRIALKSRQTLECTQESFLYDLARVVVVADERNGHGESAALVTLDQTTKRGEIAKLRQLDEGTIFRCLLGSSVLGVGRPAAPRIQPPGSEVGKEPKRRRIRGRRPIAPHGSSVVRAALRSTPLPGATRLGGRILIGKPTQRHVDVEDLGGAPHSELDRATHP